MATFKAALQNLGLDDLRLTLHCLHHGGATHDKQSSSRTLASFTTVKHYEKLEAQDLPTLLRLEPVFARCLRRTFAKLFVQVETGQPKFASTSSQGRVASHVSSENLATPFSNGTSNGELTTTSQTLLRYECC